jgi:hypothetical protein
VPYHTQVYIPATFFGYICLGGRRPRSSPTPADYCINRPLDLQCAKRANHVAVRQSSSGMQRSTQSDVIPHPLVTSHRWQFTDMTIDLRTSLIQKYKVPRLPGLGRVTWVARVGCPAYELLIVYRTGYPQHGRCKTPITYGVIRR